MEKSADSELNPSGGVPVVQLESVSSPFRDSAVPSSTPLDEEEVFHDVIFTSTGPTLLPSPPPNCASLQSWEKKLWENSLVKSVQNRFKQVLSVESSPVASRTRTSLKRTSSSADFDGDDRLPTLSEDRTSISLRKARVRRSKEESAPKKGKRED